ncbi:MULTISPECIES: chaperone modulator CbpM [Legionella]|uniref:Molecular chaperone n=1 Tax=Legionella septentrionalis TaxID=2498109 RepID=A0A3S0V6A9_9GAMM|nr:MULTISPECIES: chaperone modulator CbpM [Legionella]MCP0913976.1 chaperone modulator CbpM [Legionella sp. 27cVA30]RUQ90367.1 molecular chaperone [Legionella septentrionalis]RUR00018.1 molecular chaperone [Legionella septentrionalis]RUR10714.1 molecular chaperone [Legionella septentrionalis]RUR16533.1 molecular chaperone [Legionella septentrionalis]
MGNKQVITGLLVDENHTVSFIEVCEKYDISEELLQGMLEQGLFSHPPKDVKNLQIDYAMVRRIQSAKRLQQDLGVNIPGVVLVLELLEELEQLRSELSILQRHMEMPE